MNSKKNIVIMIIASLTLSFSGYLSAAPLKVALLDTPVSATKAYMLKYILEEKTDHKVNLVPVTIDSMWLGIVNGELDTSVSVILPQQQIQFEQYRKDIEDLGPNWIGKDIIIHTIAHKGLIQDDVPLARFLSNYCLCGERLDSAKALLKDKKISRKDAISWMNKHQPWLHNMMGFVRPFDDREDRNVTY